MAAARAVAEALTLSRPLEERLAADLNQQRGGLDARDRGLARSIATVSLRRLGTIRNTVTETGDVVAPVAPARRRPRLEASA